MEGLVTFTTVAALGAVIYTTVNFLKYVRARDWNGAVTLLVAAAVGIALAWWASEADITKTLRPIEDGPALGDMDFGSVALFGVALMSVASAGTDVRKAVDGSDTATKPPLLPPPS